MREIRGVEMGDWGAALVMSGLLALPLCAQQKSSGGGDHTTDAADRGKSATSSNTAGGGRAVGSSKPVATKGVFALPATPRPSPFPGPAAADTRAPGQLVPRFEIAGLYEYINFAPGDPFANFNNHGAAGSFTYNASKWLGLTGEFAGYRFDRNLFPLTGSNAGVSGGFVTYLFGPRLNLRKFEHI